MKVYLDVLLITNAAVCLICLEASASLTHTKLRPLRSFAGAAFGSCSALLIAIDADSRAESVLLLLIKLLFMAGSVLIAFGFRKASLRRLIPYSSAKLLLTALCFIFWQLSDSRMLIVQSFTVYFNVSVLWLILSAGAVYVLLEAAERIRALRERLEGYKAVYQRGSLIVCMPAVCDSGNKLCDSFTGQPVVVLCSDKLYFKLGLDDPDPERLRGFRLCPFNSVGGQGLMHISSAGSIRLIDPEEHSHELRCSVGIARSYSGRQRALFPPSLLE